MFRAKSIIGAAVTYAMALSGCADMALDEQEARVSRDQTIDMSSTLASQSAHAQEMSLAYERAARSSATAQDIASFVVFLGAATAIGGAIGSASDTAIANRALVGAGSELLARRGVPETAIVAIYTGAKRMNCVGAMAMVGESLLSAEKKDDPTVAAAQAITFGAIREIMITTREGLVREVADFGTIVQDLSADTGVDLEEALRGANQEGQARFERDLFNTYVKLLSNCLADAPSLDDATIKNSG